MFPKTNRIAARSWSTRAWCAGSPVLWKWPRIRKRQKTAAVQNASAPPGPLSFWSIRVHSCPNSVPSVPFCSKLFSKPKISKPAQSYPSPSKPFQRSPPEGGRARPLLAPQPAVADRTLQGNGAFGAHACGTSPPLPIRGRGREREGLPHPTIETRWPLCPGGKINCARYSLC
jgi:hypothetical protein